MITETSPKAESLTEVTPEWEPPMPPTDLIFDDGETLESNRHRIAMNLLIDSLYQHWSDRNDFFAGGNMFIYYSSTQAKNRDFKGPDFFVVLDVDGKTDRQGWVVWQEQGRYPDVIVELTSPSTASVDIGEKKDIYERTFHTQNYFIFNPFEPSSLQGWHLQNKQYQDLQPNERGWLWCDQLGLWLGTWEGNILQESGVWLRFYDSQGNLVLTAAEREHQRADQQQQLAQQERQRADQQQQIAQQERQLAERLAAKLKELGLDPDSV
ncbi:Uma2 family endonuclease [Okeania sp.]|uniref:Uma2 family endonuclease n=1 Tax=Okeania sp. TaxID=3100323 RepID=UPI002B4B75C4|nr:Uma2 family endonuclease [Okeania sp.]MEB3339233.1 Uma2 family endonuclease [Okeania sp.]